MALWRPWGRALTGPRASRAQQSTTFSYPTILLDQIRKKCRGDDSIRVARGDTPATTQFEASFAVAVSTTGGRSTFRARTRLRRRSAASRRHLAKRPIPTAPAQTQTVYSRYRYERPDLRLHLEESGGGRERERGATPFPHHGSEAARQ